MDEQLNSLAWLNNEHTSFQGVVTTKPLHKVWIRDEGWSLIVLKIDILVAR
jgi:hypothetical protein